MYGWLSLVTVGAQLVIVTPRQFVTVVAQLVTTTSAQRVLIRQPVVMYSIVPLAVDAFKDEYCGCVLFDYCGRQSHALDQRVRRDYKIRWATLTPGSRHSAPPRPLRGWPRNYH